jgi:uncharacterized membrane protein
LDEDAIVARYKTLSFALVHMTVAFSVVYLMTGSWALGGAIALLEPAANTVAYFFHEKAWERYGSRQANDKLQSEWIDDQAVA